MKTNFEIEGKSLEELMAEAIRLSYLLTYSTKTWQGYFFDVREDYPMNDGYLCDKICGWSDGLVHKYYDRMSNCECSVAAACDFDIEKFEEGVIKDIKRFTELLKKVGEPKILTRQDLRARGYRGKAAGYTEEEEKAYSIKHYTDALQSILKKRSELDKQIASSKKNPAEFYGLLYDLESETMYIEKRLKELQDTL